MSKINQYIREVVLYNCLNVKPDILSWYEDECLKEYVPMTKESFEKLSKSKQNEILNSWIEKYYDTIEFNVLIKLGIDISVDSLLSSLIADVIEDCLRHLLIGAVTNEFYYRFKIKYDNNHSQHHHYINECLEKPLTGNKVEDIHIIIEKCNLWEEVVSHIVEYTWITPEEYYSHLEC